MSSAETIAALRAVAARPVSLTTTSGTFRGSIVTDHLSDASVMLEFMLEEEPKHRIVIPVDEITDVVER